MVSVMRDGMLEGSGGFTFSLRSNEMTAVLVDGVGTVIPDDLVTFPNVLRAITALRHGLAVPLPWS